ncbi:hypothetical protein GJU43_12660 [Flavobacterium sp. LC2016-23]|uniref:Z1 domain-containing protein n=1 Tax=Flavobacterium sp. LC2016-23 TaxID=2666330 RepID=UPI0012AFFD4F|nr:Z1 domain-containing protein [Flavobacterium sp. LC2016-23]MRX40131.1 hypothetical protein [Flavobacterium sp. LC2016-23]
MSQMYNTFIVSKDYSTDLQECIEKTVDELTKRRTNFNDPGMLLGKIQSGKTRTFIGIIALAFDRGYNICVIFTKGTKALAEQTIKRLDNDFFQFIENDELKVYDIMSLPPLTPYIKQQNLIFIVKKETNNLDHLVNLFVNNPDLAQKKVLFVDDEADFASVGFKRDQNTQSGISLNVLAQKISLIRQGFENNYSFLQVTATPYSLYLQPQGELELNSDIFEPIKPAFTSLVPIHDAYIGGQQYFEESQNIESPYSKLYIRVPDNEIEVLNRRDQRYINNIISTPNLFVFRTAIINFLVGGTIRILQNELNQKKYKCSFIIHTATTKSIHQWQIELVEALLFSLTELASSNSKELKDLIKISYLDLAESIAMNGDNSLTLKEVSTKVIEVLNNKYVGVTKINSENQITALLDRNGQLRLDNPFNIFIGGQILDRGITIDNLIGFFYGRNPNTFQQDTVLQHSRMYGARSSKDMSVTRLYTSNRIYNALLSMHEFDSALRNAFEDGIHNGDNSVVFVERDAQGIIRPCAPNKILITSTQTISPHSRFLPIGFQTKSKTHIQNTIAEIDNILSEASNGNFQQPFLLEIEKVYKVIDLINSTFEYGERHENKGIEWDYITFKAIFRRLQANILNKDLEGKIYCYVQTNRNLSRKKNNGLTFSDAPDDGNTDRRIAKNIASETACLIILKQNGLKQNGWRDAEFWWPVLMTPQNSRPAVFARETIS